MRFFRFSAPLSWLAAVFLFFLPWVEIRCNSKTGQSVDVVSFSGAQLAWGGATVRQFGQPDESLLADPGEMTKSPKRKVSACLLTAYLIVLGVSSPIFLKLPLGRRRALTGCLVAASSTGLMLGGVYLLLGNPFRVDAPARMAVQVNEARFTVWYAFSHLANGWALVSFALECWTMPHSAVFSRSVQPDNGG